MNTRLDAQNRLSADRVRWVGVQIADALAGAHSAGILHRGVTPAKILIDSYGNARLTDFGLAAVVGAGIEGTDPPPAPSAYTPPEAFDETPTTEFGDVFSLGATLVALLTGQAPPRVAATTVGKDRGSEGAPVRCPPSPRRWSPR